MIMKIKKILFSCMLVMGCLTAAAQEPEVKTENVFNPHWYLQIQPVGVQYTLGELSYNRLMSYNVQLGAGYQFNPIVGLRLSVNAWESRGGLRDNDIRYKYKWNYVAPMLDATVNLTNVFWGFNPHRVFNFSVFAGVGVNVAWNNDDAADVQQSLSGYNLQYLWDGTKARMVGRAGLMIDFRLCDAVVLGLEAQANTLTDHYNSKKASDADWYFNALLGIKVNLRKTYKVKEIVPPEVPERVVERVVERVKEPAPVPPAPPAVEPLRRDVFFQINSARISDIEKQKIAEIAEYMQKHPDSKVQITSYADKDTGNPTINQRLSEERSQSVANSLKDEFGIAESRISTSAKGDTEQPFDTAVMNRTSICIAQ